MSENVPELCALSHSLISVAARSTCGSVRSRGEEGGYGRLSEGLTVSISSGSSISKGLCVGQSGRIVLVLSN